MSKKYIHYCWFGGKPLPKLAKKCIKSWKKYLPDYEIIRWSEENVDLNECPFIKEAYENKKWAFVADYARTKAMYEYGGIYFDTDMKITKNIDFLLDKETFLGVEDSGMVNAAVWGASKPKTKFAKQMLEFYRSQEHFNEDKIYEYTIPTIITNILSKIGFDNKNINKIQNLDNQVFVYPREYFYPLSYNYKNNIFTENTCMIHYFDASWIPKGEKKSLKVYRIFGTENGEKLIKVYRVCKKTIKRILKVFLFPIVIIKRHYSNKVNYEKRMEKFSSQFESITRDYVAIYHFDWLGVMFSTKILFDSTVGLHKIFNDSEAEKVANLLLEKKLKLIIFNAFADGWDKVCEYLRKKQPDIKIKILWHGSNAMNIENYDWDMFNKIFELLQNHTINSIGFVKKSMYELYKQKGYNVEFVMNKMDITNKYPNNNNNSTNIKIGLYASGDRWVKNFYNQLAGASLIDNAVIDCIPLSPKSKKFAQLLNVQINGVSNTIDRENLLKRLSQNDINVYATFVECAPLLPLESLEMGVPCITGNNHHYWEGHDLEEYLIIDKVDNPIAIAEKIKYCIDNKEKIINLYNSWKKDYNKKADKSIEDFLKINN